MSLCLVRSESGRVNTACRADEVSAGERNHGKKSLVESVIKANPYNPRTIPRSSLDQRDTGLPSAPAPAEHDSKRREEPGNSTEVDAAGPSRERAMPRGFKRVEGVRYDWVDISEDGDMGGPGARG